MEHAINSVECMCKIKVQDVGKPDSKSQSKVKTQSLNESNPKRESGIWPLGCLKNIMGHPT